MLLIDKLKAGITGAIIGDAVGVPYEFRTKNEMTFNPCMDMVGYGTYNKPSGTWSDDSSMTLATLDAVIDKKIDLHQMMINFIDWQVDGKYTQDGFMFSIGNTTGKAIKEYKNSLNTEICGQKGENNNGNGSLMRIFPVAVYLYNLYGVDALKNNKAVELIKKVSSLTHAHDISVTSCIIYVSVAIHLLNEEGKEGIIAGINDAKPFIKDKVFDKLLSPNFFTLPDKEIDGKGYVVDTLQASLYLTYNSKGYKEAILKAVNLGDDTDTTASVTGALAGILYQGNIDEAWIKGIRNLDYAMDLCEKFIENIK